VRLKQPTATKAKRLECSGSLRRRCINFCSDRDQKLKPGFKMFQPGLKDKMMPKQAKMNITCINTMCCYSARRVARALLFVWYRQTDQGSETRKEQPCQHLRSHQSSTDTRSRSTPYENGTVRRVPESARRATMPRSFTPMEAKRLRTSCQSSYMRGKSNSGRPTRSTEDAWSARSISETRILRITFPSGSDRLEFQEELL